MLGRPEKGLSVHQHYFTECFSSTPSLSPSGPSPGSSGSGACEDDQEQFESYLGMTSWIVALCFAITTFIEFSALVARKSNKRYARALERCQISPEPERTLMGVHAFAPLSFEGYGRVDVPGRETGNDPSIVCA